MKATVEQVNSVQRRIKVELSEADVNKAFTSVYGNLRKKAQIKGFRPGKAPLSILKKFYGNSAAVDVADNLVRQHLFSAIQEQELNPISAPVLETSELPKEDEQYAFSALVDIMPEIKVEGYKGLALTHPKFEVSASLVDREMEFLQKNQGKRQEVDAGVVAEKSHIVTFSQTASTDGEELAAFKLEDMQIELGRGFIAPEFDEGVIGMAAGENKKISLTIPDSFQDKSLVGKTVVCEVTVKKIEELKLPELNDEFAKDLGSESLNALRERMEKDLLKHADQQKRQSLEADLLQKLSEKNSFEIPPALVDQVIDGMFDEMQFPSEQEKKEAKKDQERRKSMRDSAKQRAKNSLMLAEIIKAEKIEVTDGDIDDHLKEMITANQPGAKSEDIDDKLLESLKASYGNQAKESLLFKKAMDFVIDSAEVTELESTEQK